MTERSRTQDWTQGETTILYQACPNCLGVWYFRREFCPSCGSRDATIRQASGRGTVAAACVVTRAPTAELSRHAPYCIVLIDADEGFRLMAQGDRLLAIGERVMARFVTFGNGIIPYFERNTS